MTAQRTRCCGRISTTTVGSTCITGNYLDPNRLYLNNGDGTFTDATDAWNAGNAGPCRSLHAADIDGDGWLDLYVVNINSHNAMLRNLEGTGFQNVTFPSGTVDTGIGMGALFFDSDNDGDVDLYVTHDGNQVNKFFRNNGQGSFTQDAAGVGLDYQGNCMGVDAADINHDGWMDLYITDLYPSELFLNNGDGTYTAIGEAAGVDDSGMTWGCIFFDYDHDAQSDLYIVNDYAFAPTSNRLYRGLGDTTFAWVSEGDAVLEHDHSDYGLAAGDLDGDGDWDLAIATSGSPTQPGFQVLENLNSTVISSASDSRAPPLTDRPLARALRSTSMAKSAMTKSIAAKGTAVPVRSTSMSVWALQPASTPSSCAGPLVNTPPTDRLLPTASMRCWNRVPNRG